MSFTVDYLGAEVTQVGLNYSRPAAQILGQYYQFIRLGSEGLQERAVQLAHGGQISPRADRVDGRVPALCPGGAQPDICMAYEARGSEVGQMDTL